MQKIQNCHPASGFDARPLNGSLRSLSRLAQSKGGTTDSIARSAKSLKKAKVNLTSRKCAKKQGKNVMELLRWEQNGSRNESEHSLCSALPTAQRGLRLLKTGLSLAASVMICCGAPTLCSAASLTAVSALPSTASLVDPFLAIVAGIYLLAFGYHRAVERARGQIEAEQAYWSGMEHRVRAERSPLERARIALKHVQP